MRTIWKYPLRLTDVQRVPMPEGARLLYVAEQDRVLCLWASVESDAPTIDRLIGIVGTGNPAPEDDDGAPYVGSAVCGQFVWHVYDGGQANHV